MHVHGECFIYKDTKISIRLREWYVVARYGHRSKTGGDLIYLRLGTNGNELSFIIIHLWHTVTRPLSDIFNTVFQTLDKSWEVWGNTRVVELGIICKEMVWVAWLTNGSARDCVYFFFFFFFSDRKPCRSDLQSGWCHKTSRPVEVLIIIIIIIIAFKGAIRDFLQSPHSAANRLQHVRSSGPGATVCKSRETHRALIMCKCHVMCHLVRRDSSAIKFDRVEIAFIWALFYWLNR